MKKTKNYDFKKRIENKRKLRIQQIATAVVAFGLVTSPLSVNFNKNLSFDYHTVSADTASLAQVNLLGNTSVSQTAVGTNAYDITVAGTALADLELLGTNRKGVAQVDLSSIPEELRDQVTITSEGAHVHVELLPITMADLPA
ncbi:adhesive domain-containing protein [Brochothrix campestris]|uniref:Putative adhesive domain-containing protein n=1 Tax=Brochothrix campestris FSL F6-1037 TaxID=1265861 RepID=W7D9V3_9LIST|nr:adhesive domain-containing protein [Brochothrix campestris]EUJ42048.1 hypothetical protein BCAMP_01565 [Brochothrix campestris FSL F6-1037]